MPQSGYSAFPMMKARKAKITVFMKIIKVQKSVTLASLSMVFEDVYAERVYTVLYNVTDSSLMRA